MVPNGVALYLNGLPTSILICVRTVHLLQLLLHDSIENYFSCQKSVDYSFWLRVLFHVVKLILFRFHGVTTLLVGTVGDCYDDMSCYFCFRHHWNERRDQSDRDQINYCLNHVENHCCPSFGCLFFLKKISILIFFFLFVCLVWVCLFIL